MSKPLDEPNLGDDTNPTRLPPIRIVDMLVLTASMAFIFMLLEKMDRRQLVLNVNPIIDFIFALLYAVPSGISLAAVYWLVTQKRITGRFLRQPGH